MQTRNRTNEQGFTLAELMVVIVIIGLLTTLVAKDVMGFLSGGRRTAAVSDITQIGEALTTYAIKNGQYPEDLEVLVQRDDNGHRYLDRGKVPKDPWGTEYYYEMPYGGEELNVISYGQDKQPGGEGDDADISLLQIQDKE
jgi:general secretion pathway protein G